MCKLMVKRPLLRYHGGKWKLAPWILRHLPPHRVYVEPFGGGGSVLLQKPRSYAEVYNDLDGEIVNLFRVARERGEELAQAVELTPFARLDRNLAEDRWELTDIDPSGCAEVVEPLYTAPQPKREPQWIAVSDQLPTEEDGEVLVRMRDGRYEIAWATYWHGASNEFAHWTFRDPDEDETPTHWQRIGGQP